MQKAAALVKCRLFKRGKAGRGLPFQGASYEIRRF